MKRVATVTLLLALAAAATFTLGAGDGGGSYKVRAIFDNAGFVIPGEDVKVAGVKVGKIDSMDITRDFKAVVVLDIQDAAYQDFRTDARCQVRPQSLIGEKFVECTPTQKRAAGTEPPPALRQIERGEGEGQYLLPVENTEKSVDLDLLNNIMRLPYRQRLSLVVSELGTGLAGRGTELNQVIRRADPALKEVDKVLALLASQNKVLSDLARDSDTALAPLAREREHVSGFIEHSSNVAEATAERSADLEADIERLPRFLQELRPTMRRIGALSDEARPVFSALGDAAPDINRLVRELGPFSKAGIPAVESLGEAGKIGTPAMRDALPVTKDLRRFAKVAKPVGKTAAAGARVLQEGPRHRAPARLRLLPGGRHQRLRLLRPLPARAPDPQHLLALLHGAGRRLLEPLRLRGRPGGERHGRVRRRHRPDPPPHHRRAPGQGPRLRRAAARADRDAAARPAHRGRHGAGEADGGPAPGGPGGRAPTSNANEGEAVLDYLFGKDAG